MTRWKNTFNKNAALIYDGFRCQVRILSLPFRMVLLTGESSIIFWRATFTIIFTKNTVPLTSWTSSCIHQPKCCATIIVILYTWAPVPSQTERPAVQTPHHPDPLYLINITQIQLHRACPYYEYKAAHVQSFSILLRNNYVWNLDFY